MKYIKTLLFAVPLLILVNQGGAFGAQDSNPRTISEEFIQKVVSGNINEAIDEGFAPEVKTIIGNNVNQSKGQIVGILDLLGPIEDYEFVREEDLSNRVRRVIYFVYTENYPIAFYLFYYGRADDWQLISFTFDTNFEDSHPQE